LVWPSKGASLLKARVFGQNNLRNINNLHNIRGLDVVTAERRLHRARIVRPGSE
jgi:hypothetical protein